VDSEFLSIKAECEIREHGVLERGRCASARKIRHLDITREACNDHELLV